MKALRIAAWAVGLCLHGALVSVFVHGCVRIESTVTIPFLRRDYSVIGDIIPNLWFLLFVTQVISIVPIVVFAIKRHLPGPTAGLAYALIIAAQIPLANTFLGQIERLGEFAYGVVGTIPAADQALYERICNHLLAKGFVVCSPAKSEQTWRIMIAPKHPNDVTLAQESLRRAGIPISVLRDSHQFLDQ